MPCVLAMTLLASGIIAQGAQNMSLRLHQPYPIGTATDVWGEGDLLFLARRGEGYVIMNVANSSAPAVLYSGRAELFIQDVKSRGNLLACSNESGNGRGVYLFDITDPANPVELSSFGSALMPTCNNVAFFGNTLYCCSYITNQVIVLDITNPSFPVQVGTIQSPALISLLHDVAVVGSKLYISWLSGGFAIHDLAANPMSPPLVASKAVPTSLVHNTWPLADGIHVATADETSGGFMTIWNVSNPQSVVAVSSWRASTIAVMHDLHIHEHFAFITNYTEGVRVVDVQSPATPVEAGYFDTFTGASALAFGAWGVFPFDRDTVYVADFSSGLYLLEFHPMTASLAAASATAAWGTTIDLTAGISSTVTTNIPCVVDLSFSVAEIGPGSATLLSAPIVLNAGVSGQAPFPILLPPDVGLGQFTVTLTLSLTSASNARLYDAATTTVVIN